MKVRRFSDPMSHEFAIGNTEGGGGKGIFLKKSFSFSIGPPSPSLWQNSGSTSSYKIRLQTSFVIKLSKSKTPPILLLHCVVFSKKMIKELSIFNKYSYWAYRSSEAGISEAIFIVRQKNKC